MSNENRLPHDYCKTRLDEAEPDQLWSEKRTADHLGLAPKTLRQWRSLGGFLPFVRLGGRTIRYRREDVEVFIARGLRLNTSDPGDRR